MKDLTQERSQLSSRTSWRRKSIADVSDGRDDSLSGLTSVPLVQPLRRVPTL